MMSANQQAKTSRPGVQRMQTKPEESPEEEELQKALKQLKLLHIRVCIYFLITLSLPYYSLIFSYARKTQD